MLYNKNCDTNRLEKRHMNVFGILNSDNEETLTEENYSEKTNKDKPYYRPEISSISPYFAICPRCKNPIQIINLYNMY